MLCNLVMVPTFHINLLLRSSGQERIFHNFLMSFPNRPSINISMNFESSKQTFIRVDVRGIISKKRVNIFENVESKKYWLR